MNAVFEHFVPVKYILQSRISNNKEEMQGRKVQLIIETHIFFYLYLWAFISVLGYFHI